MNKFILLFMFKNIFASYNVVEPPPITEFTQNVVDVEDNLQDISFYHQPIEKESRQETVQTVNPFVKDFKITQKPDKTKSIIDNARSFLGKPYVWGGKTPKSGFDCSGLIGHVFKQAGYNIGTSTSQQVNAGTKIDIANAKPGDIIVTRSSSSPSGRHVKLISKVENGQMYAIEAKGKKWGIVETPIKDTKNIISVRRIVNG